MPNIPRNRAHLLALGALLAPIVGLGCVGPTHRSTTPLSPEEREVLNRSIERIERERGDVAPVANTSGGAAKVGPSVSNAQSETGSGAEARQKRPASQDERAGDGKRQARTPREGATPEGRTTKNAGKPTAENTSEPRANATDSTLGSLQGRVEGIDAEGDAPLVLLAIPIGRVTDHSKGTTVLSRGVDGFDPPFLVVPIGETVRFENEDEICHSFFSSSPNHEFELGLLDPDTSSSYRVEQPGTVQVYCTLHSGKQASVFAVPTPHFAVVAGDGSYNLGRLEAGAYRAMLWSDGEVLRRHELDIAPGKPTNWNVTSELVAPQAESR